MTEQTQSFNRDDRVDPPLRGDEVSTLRAFLDFQRDTFRWKCAGLTQEQLAQPLPPSDMTLGGMMKHLAIVDSSWFEYDFAGGEFMPPFDSVDWDADGDWEWHTAKDDSPEELLRGVVTGAVPLPVRIGVPVDGLERRRIGLADQRVAEPPDLVEGEVLHHPAERHLGRRQPLRQLLLGEPAALPPQRVAVVVEEAAERGELVGPERCLGARALVERLGHALDAIHARRRVAPAFRAVRRVTTARSRLRRCG